MTTTCEHDLGFCENKALNNIFAAPRGTKPEQFIEHVPFEAGVPLQSGNIVIVHSRGNWRNAVVESIGTKRVSVVYTTDGAVKESVSLWETLAHLTTGTIVAQGAEARAQSERNWDYKAGDYPDRLRAIWAKHGAEKVAEEAAKWDVERAAFLAENPSRDEYGQAAADRTVIRQCEKRDHAIAVGRFGYVNFTRKSVPFAQVYVPKVRV